MGSSAWDEGVPGRDARPSVGNGIMVRRARLWNGVIGMIEHRGTGRRLDVRMKLNP